MNDTVGRRVVDWVAATARALGHMWCQYRSSLSSECRPASCDKEHQYIIQYVKMLLVLCTTTN